MMLFLFNVQLRNKYDDDDDDNAELKLSMLSVGSRRESGNEFQTIGAATELQSPIKLHNDRIFQYV